MASSPAGVLELPAVDLAGWLARGDDAEACAAIAQQLRDTGIVVVRDPRVPEAANDDFLDMLERYWEQPPDATAPDEHPEIHYQVGRTPSGVELPRNHCARFKAAQPADQPLTPCPPEKDAKGRFFWRIGAQPATTAFPLLNAPPVVPAAFAAEWARTMDGWGGALLGTALAVAEMLAVGLGLPADALTARMAGAPHLLAPTASDLRVHGARGTVLAGVHYDLNFLSVHGRSRFPGLYVWTRAGARVAVRLPPGCLLLQAGKQLEHVTGGHVAAGFHEVVVDDGALAAVAAAAAAGRSRVRISSTLFAHLASDVLLAPLGRFAADAAAVAAYPPTLCGDHVAAELRAINLAAGGGAGGAGGDGSEPAAVAAM